MSAFRPIQKKYCRICFEKEYPDSKLISPCKCRGSSQYIHVHCLETWQETSLQNNTPSKAMKCPVCLAYYNYPGWFILAYRRLIQGCKVMSTMLSLLWISMAVAPLKMVLHAMLVILTIPFGQLSLGGDMAIAWVGCDFPPQLALIRCAQHVSIPFLKRGVLLIASQHLPMNSIFYRAVILVLEHSSINGSRGILLTSSTSSLPPSTSLGSFPMPSPRSNVGNVTINVGGHMDADVFTVLHDHPAAAEYSQILPIRNDNNSFPEKRKNIEKNRSKNTHNIVYTAEYDHAYHTVQLLLHLKLLALKTNQNHEKLSKSSEVNHSTLIDGNHIRQQSSRNNNHDRTMPLTPTSVTSTSTSSSSSTSYHRPSFTTISSSLISSTRQYIRCFQLLVSHLHQRIGTMRIQIPSYPPEHPLHHLLLPPNSPLFRDLSPFSPPSQSLQHNHNDNNNHHQHHQQGSFNEREANLALADSSPIIRNSILHQPQQQQYGNIHHHWNTVSGTITTSDSTYTTDPANSNHMPSTTTYSTHQRNEKKKSKALRNPNYHGISLLDRKGGLHLHSPMQTQQQLQQSQFQSITSSPYAMKQSQQQHMNEEDDQREVEQYIETSSHEKQVMESTILSHDKNTIQHPRATTISSSSSSKQSLACHLPTSPLISQQQKMCKEVDVREDMVELEEEIPVEQEEDEEEFSPNIRFFQGNCLWSPGQLPGEVLHGDWHVLPPKIEYLFPPSHSLASQDLWSLLMTKESEFLTLQNH
jgi:putative AlgH/UPF0301 family transcriptional regulator